MKSPQSLFPPRPPAQFPNLGAVLEPPAQAVFSPGSSRTAPSARGEELTALPASQCPGVPQWELRPSRLGVIPTQHAGYTQRADPGRGPQDRCGHRSGSPSCEEGQLLRSWACISSHTGKQLKPEVWGACASGWVGPWVVEAAATHPLPPPPWPRRKQRGWGFAQGPRASDIRTQDGAPRRLGWARGWGEEGRGRVVSVGPLGMGGGRRLEAPRAPCRLTFLLPGATAPPAARPASASLTWRRCRLPG